MKLNAVWFALSSLLWSGFAQAMPDFNWDLKTHYPHAETQLSSLDAAQLASLQAYNNQYGVPSVYQANPNGTGASQADMDWVASVPAYFGLSRDPVSGELSGRGIVIYGQGDGFEPDLTKPATSRDFHNTCKRLADVYWASNAAQAPQITQVYTDLIEHFLDQNYLPGGKGRPWLSGGYVWREHGWFPMRLAHVLPVEMRDLLGMSMFYVSSCTALDASPYVSTDDFYNNVNTAFVAGSMISNGPEKWQLLKLARRGIDRSIFNLIPKDGSIIHHSGHHTHYAAYSFDNTISHLIKFTAAGINHDETSGEAVQRFRRAALAWSFVTTGGINPAHQNMRSALPSGYATGDGGFGRGPGWLYRAAELTAYYQKTPLAADLEMAYAYYAKTGGSQPAVWQSIVPPANPDRNSPFYTAALRGFYSHTTNGTSVFRGPGQWYVSVRSQHPNYRGGEAYSKMGYPDHFNNPSMWSALEVITTGKDGRKPNEVDSGIILDGWNYYFYPNLTIAGDVDAQASLLSWKTPAYKGGGGNPVGSANLRESGLWMADSGYRKSGFFLGNRIVLSTTDISGANLHTGLIQHGTVSAAPALSVDGVVKSQSGDWNLSAGGNHTFVDPQGNAYFVHPGAATAPMKVRRGKQEWTYATGPYLGSDGWRDYTYSWEFVRDWSLWKPSSGNYSRVWFDHGTQASGQSLEYTLLVKPQPGELAAYVAAMTNPATAPVIVRKNSRIHRYFDRATGTYGAAVFNPSEPVQQGGLISVTRPAAYLWRRDGNQLHLSISSSAWGDPFEVTLAGKWSFVSAEDTGEVETTEVEGNTVISLPQWSEYPLRVVLQSEDGMLWKEFSKSVDVDSDHTLFGVDLAASGIGTSPDFTIVSGNDSGLFSVQAGQLVATRSFARSDVGTVPILIRVSDGATVVGSIAVNIEITDEATVAALKDTDGDGFRDAFEFANQTNPLDAESRPQTALVAWWNFDQTGGVTPFDVVGGIPGVFTGTAGISSPGQGRSGTSGDQALDLGSTGNGADYRVTEVEFLRKLAANDELTVSLWQKFDSNTITNNFTFFASSPSAGANRGLSLIAPWTDQVYYFEAGGTAAVNRLASTATLNRTAWNHIALVKDKAAMQLWINGNLVKSETGKAPLVRDFANLVLGSSGGANSSIVGDLDDFAIFSKALNSAQIAALADGDSPDEVVVVGNQPPVISTSQIVVAENGVTGGTVGTLTATDPDGPGAITWTIEGTALADMFVVEGSTGVIRLAASATLNFEERSSYPLTVVATDSSGALSRREIEIVVGNVNEAPTVQGFSALLSEQTAAGSLIGTATMTDPDLNQAHSWSITAGNSLGVFAINASSGAITLAQNHTSLDGEVQLTIRCTDAGGLSGNGTVIIKIFRPSDAAVDSDGDGFTDAFEDFSETDPDDSNSVPSTDLAAFWNFDQSGTPTFYPDWVGGILGQPLGGAGLSAAGAGRSASGSDRALDLGSSGSGPRVEVAATGWWNQLAANDRVTLSFWRKFHTSNGFGCAFWGVSPTAAGQRGLAVFAPWSDSVLYVDHGGTAASNRTTLGDGSARTAWVHYAIVKNGDTVEVWIDGVRWKTESGKAALQSDFNQLILGAQPGGSASLRGLLDEVAIFSSALNADQIAALKRGVSPLLIEQEALIASTTPEAAVETLGSWRNLQFADSSNAEISGNSADPDRDGLDNLLEFALGTAPQESTARVIRGAVANRQNHKHLTLTFQSPGPREDLNLEFEVSASLGGPWTSYNAFDERYQESVATAGNGLFAYTVFDPQPLGGRTSRFIRLKASPVP